MIGWRNRWGRGVVICSWGGRERVYPRVLGEKKGVETLRQKTSGCPVRPKEKKCKKNYSKGRKKKENGIPGGQDFNMWGVT